MKKQLSIVSLTLIIFFCLTAFGSAAKIKVEKRSFLGSGLLKMAVWNVTVEQGDSIEKIANQMNGKSWVVNGVTIEIPDNYITPEMIFEEIRDDLKDDPKNLKTGYVFDYPFPLLD